MAEPGPLEPLLPEPERNRATGAFERKVARALDTHAGSPEPLLVACSGGPDSSAALVAVVRAREAAGGAEVVAATFDHRLRPAAETRADRAAVEALTRRLGVRCVAGEPAGAGEASEAAAREARYRWLRAAAGELGASACVTGHTLDDQAETVLLRLTRGSGLRGAAGMAANSPWPVSRDDEADARSPRLLRPLLELRRDEVEDYIEALGLAALGLAPRLDPSNETLAFDRNRVRRRVLPELRRLNPRAAEALAGFAQRARRDDAALEAWAEAECRRLVRIEGARARVDRTALRELPEAIALRVLQNAAARLAISLDAGRREELLAIASRRGARLALAGGRAWTEGGELYLERA